jgi:hypothetical protein
VIQSEQQSSPNALAYSRPPALAWVSRRRRMLLAIALLVAIGAVIFQFRWALLQRATWLYWSHPYPGNTGASGVIDAYLQNDDSLSFNFARHLN